MKAFLYTILHNHTLIFHFSAQSAFALHTKSMQVNFWHINTAITGNKYNSQFLQNQKNPLCVLAWKLFPLFIRPLANIDPFQKSIMIHQHC